MLVDLAIAQRALTWEVENGVGDYWWLSVLKALTGSSGSSNGETGTPTTDPKNVRWL